MIHLSVEGGPESNVGNDVRVRIPVNDDMVDDIYLVITHEGITIDTVESGVVITSNYWTTDDMLDDLNQKEQDK